MSRYFRYAGGKAWEAERNGCTAHDSAREFLWIHIDGVKDDVDSILDEFTHIPHQAIAALKAVSIFDAVPSCFLSLDEGEPGD
mgnify:CR=1 FL=1